jgi:glycosyltransferase involved in cell wall biosynthesis
MTPRVSVVIPNYNHAPYLKERIDSVLNQTFQDFELILLDDCSTDNSRDIINSYAKNPHVSHIILNEENTRNTFVQWERGIRLASGEYIWIAESDDKCEPTLLEKLVAEFKRDNNLVLAFSLPLS